MGSIVFLIPREPRIDGLGESAKSSRPHLAAQFLLLEWGGRLASPRDENFLREGGGRLRLLSSVCLSGPDRKSRPGRRRPKHHGKRNVLETFLGPLAKSLQNVTPVDFLDTGEQKACDVLHILGSGIRKRRILLRRLILATCQALLAISEQKCLTGGQF